MLIEITALYDGQCFETKRHIPKGAKALYNPRTRTLWNWESKKYMEFRAMMPGDKNR